MNQYPSSENKLNSNTQEKTKMKYDIYGITTYPPRKCGVGTFAENLFYTLHNNRKKINSVNVAPIENQGDYKQYTIPIINDWKIDQDDSESWKKAGYKIVSDAINGDIKNKVAILQHEFGLDPKYPGDIGGWGNNFVDLAKILYESGIMTVSYLHTVKPQPSSDSLEEVIKHYEHEKRTLKELAKYNDGLIVTAQKAVDILVDEYRIPQSKVEHIPHGTRDFTRSNNSGRDEVKAKYGLEGKLVYSRTGMRSPTKGIGNNLRAYGQFLNKNFSGGRNKEETEKLKREREKLIYIDVGGYHPHFVSKNNGKDLRDYQNYIQRTVKESNLKSQTTNNPKELGKLAKENDVIFLEPGLKESYVPEDILIDTYVMTNGMVLLYDNDDQISSGPLSDAIGSGRATIATKFPYAVEMLNPKGNNGGGIIGMDDSRARGLLVDNKDVINQTVKCFEYLTFNEQARKRIEENAGLAGSKMKWPIVGNDLLRYLDYLNNLKHQGKGKDPVFRKK